MWASPSPWVSFLLRVGWQAVRGDFAACWKSKITALKSFIFFLDLCCQKIRQHYAGVVVAVFHFAFCLNPDLHPASLLSHWFSNHFLEIIIDFGYSWPARRCHQVIAREQTIRKILAEFRKLTAGNIFLVSWVIFYLKRADRGYGGRWLEQNLWQKADDKHMHDSVSKEQSVEGLIHSDFERKKRILSGSCLKVWRGEEGHSVCDIKELGIKTIKTELKIAWNNDQELTFSQVIVQRRHIQKDLVERCGDWEPITAKEFEDIYIYIYITTWCSLWGKVLHVGRSHWKAQRSANKPDPVWSPSKVTGGWWGSGPPGQGRRVHWKKLNQDLFW